VAGGEKEIREFYAHVPDSLPSATSRKKLATILYHFARCGMDIPTIHITEGYKDIIKECAEAAKAGAKLIIIYGGDGSVNAAINGCMQNKLPLAIIAGGTANVFARILQLPLEIDKAVKTIAAANKCKVDVGLCNGTYFGCVIGVGFDAFVIKRTSPVAKAYTGILSFLVTAVMSLYSFPRRRMPIYIDGKRYRCFSAIILNGQQYAGSVVMAPGAEMTDGKFDCILFRRKTIFSLFSYLWALKRQKTIDSRHAIRVKAQKVKITKAGYEFQMDGEPMGKTPLEMTVTKCGLEVIRP